MRTTHILLAKRIAHMAAINQALACDANIVEPHAKNQRLGRREFSPAIYQLNQKQRQNTYGKGIRRVLPWIKIGRSMEELAYNLAEGNFSVIMRSLSKRINKWMGKEKFS